MSASSQPFAGQWALVTGAGGGIGSAIAQGLAEGGASVGLVGRNRARLERGARKIGQHVAVVLPADLTVDTEAEAALRRFLLCAGGRLDILVHSSGIHSAAPLEQARARDFDRLWATNVRAPFVVTRRLTPALRAARGQIVFVNSSAGLEARPGAGLYSAAEHALRALADSFRAELNPDGIRVLSVYPGRTATRMQAKIFRDEGRPYVPERLLQPADIARTVMSALELPRSAEVTDVRIRSLVKP